MKTFAEYMENKLYGPGGYYSSGAGKSGRAGDYFTAPDVSPIFGRLLAAVLAHWAEEFATRPFHCVEAGAGEGALAAAVSASFASDHPLLCEHLRYVALERSDTRRAALRELAHLSACAVQAMPDLSTFEGSPVDGCIFANELIDALPVHRVRMRGGRLEEGFVRERSDKTGEWAWDAPSTPALAQYLERARIALPDGYETEINLAMSDWLRNASAALRSGFLLVIDYGRPAHSYYDVTRDQGTLRGFRQHEVRRDVLGEGIMDITADVDFTSFALDAKQWGFKPLAFLELGPFLTWAARLLVGKLRTQDTVEELMAAPSGRSPWSGFRYLVHPEGLGGAFHVLILGKGLDPADWPFEHNRLHRLGLPTSKENS